MPRSPFQGVSWCACFIFSFLSFCCRRFVSFWPFLFVSFLYVFILIPFLISAPPSGAHLNKCVRLPSLQPHSPSLLLFLRCFGSPLFLFCPPACSAYQCTNFHFDKTLPSAALVTGHVNVAQTNTLTHTHTGTHSHTLEAGTRE